MTDYWPQIIPAVSGLLGTLVGGLITWSVQASARREDRGEKRYALAQAIAAEIEAYLDIVKMRDHIGYVNGILKMNKQGIPTIPKNLLSPFEKQKTPFQVLEANFSNIGSLGDVCKDIAVFYSRIVAVRTSLIMADEGAYDALLAPDIARILQSEIDLWQNGDRLGRNVVAQLRTITR